MYKLSKNSFGQLVIIRNNGNDSVTSFNENTDNTDYQAYLAWVAEGNTPEGATE